MSSLRVTVTAMLASAAVLVTVKSYTASVLGIWWPWAAMSVQVTTLVPEQLHMMKSASLSMVHAPKPIPNQVLGLIVKLKVRQMKVINTL